MNLNMAYVKIFEHLKVPFAPFDLFQVSTKTSSSLDYIWISNTGLHILVTETIYSPFSKQEISWDVRVSMLI